jgi:hypothetical protein
VRGSRELDSNYGYYHLVKRNYEIIVNNPGIYFAVVYKEPDFTFIFNGNELKEIFGKYEPTIPKERPPRWHFDILNKEGHYYLKLHNKFAKEHYIDNNLNKWDQIKEFKHKSEMSTDFENVKHDSRHFLVQVNELGSQNLLRNNAYRHKDWRTTPRDRAHGEVGVGDILIVYFGKKSIEFRKQLKKVYRVNDVTRDNSKFKVSEIKELNGMSYEQIKLLRENGKLDGEAFKKIGQQGFNIAEIEKTDYDQVLILDSSLPSFINAQMNFTDLQLFILKKMDPHANYQPIMIRTLLLSGGRASRDEIAQRLKESNLSPPAQGFQECPCL